MSIVFAGGTNEPEVGEEDAARLRVNQDVGRLYVCVQKAARVGSIERRSDLLITV